MSEPKPVPVLSESPTGSMKVWDPPCDDREYVIGVDVAEGKVRDRTALQRRTNINYGSKRPDYSAAVVIELITGLHVASWHGYVPPDEYAGTVAAMGMYYNDALLTVEMNGPGISVLSRLTETLAYDNMYRSRLWNVIGQDPTKPTFGFQTNPSSRKQLMMHVHAAINSNQLFTRDALLIDELRTMEFDEAGVERGRGSNKDDMVLAFALALEGRYASGSQVAPPPRTPANDRRGYDDAVWRKVKALNQDHEDASNHNDSNRPSRRGFTGGRSSMGRRGPRGPRPGRF